MSWQEEEIRKRREEATNIAERERKRAICVAHIKELWARFLETNNSLPKELRLAVSRKPLAGGNHYVESIVGNSNIEHPYYNCRSISFDSCYESISYEESHIVHGGPPPTFEYEILYNQDEKYYFTCSSHSSYKGCVEDNSYLIDMHGVETMIRNLCRGAYNVTQDLHRVHRVSAISGQKPPKRKKFLGLF